MPGFYYVHVEGDDFDVHAWNATEHSKGRELGFRCLPFGLGSGLCRLAFAQGFLLGGGLALGGSGAGVLCVVERRRHNGGRFQNGALVSGCPQAGKAFAGGHRQWAVCAVRCRCRSGVGAEGHRIELHGLKKKIRGPFRK